MNGLFRHFVCFEKFHSPVSELIHLARCVKLKVPVTLFFSFLDEKLSHPWIQIKKKKRLNFLRLSMGFDRKKIKI